MYCFWPQLLQKGKWEFKKGWRRLIWFHQAFLKYLIVFEIPLIHAIFWARVTKFSMVYIVMPFFSLIYYAHTYFESKWFVSFRIQILCKKFFVVIQSTIQTLLNLGIQSTAQWATLKISILFILDNAFIRQLKRDENLSELNKVLSLNILSFLNCLKPWYEGNKIW